jgi:glucokinase
MYVIAGDIGGTKTLLQLIDISGSNPRVVREKRFDSTAFPTFELLLQQFLQRSDPEVDAACFAVAGAVIGNRARVTNLDWDIDGAFLSENLRIGQVGLINDFVAVAMGVPLLDADDFIVINEGEEDETAPIAILGAGTGLGQAIVVPIESGWRVLASEGGHAGFAPVGAIQRELLADLERKYGRVSVERVVSGLGISDTYDFFLRRSGAPGLSGLDEIESIPARVAELAGRGDEIATRTFELFVDAYGAEAGDLGLKVLARGGVYLAGGIAAKNLDWFTDGRFLRSFTNKGRFSELASRFPVRLITNPSVGLLGAAHMAAASAGAGRTPFR